MRHVVQPNQPICEKLPDTCAGMKQSTTMFEFVARLTHFRNCSDDDDDTDFVLEEIVLPSALSSKSVQLSWTLELRLKTAASKVVADELVRMAFTGQKTSAVDTVVDWFDTPHWERSTMPA
jgi:hypothetical protein